MKGHAIGEKHPPSRTQTTVCKEKWFPWKTNVLSLSFFQALQPFYTLTRHSHDAVFIVWVTGSLQDEFCDRPPNLLEIIGKQWTSRHPAFWNTFAAMASKLKVNTLEGSVVTVQVMPTNTIQELKAMLHEKKHCEDSIEHKILRVKLMMDGLLVDDDQALEAAGLLHAESEVTVIYSRNEVEAATKEAIHEEGFLQVNIPSSLTRIPARAFQAYNQVVRVAIPQSVTAIGDRAFAGCSSLESITIPDSVTAIGASAFSGCSSLESITIPDSVTAIGEGAFARCMSLASVTISNSVTSTGSFAFKDCSSLASITIPDSVIYIGVGAFVSCSSLASVTIPESVTTIGNSAFLKCTSLGSVTIPESVTTIGEDAFHGCRSLASITIPESVTRIGEHTFGKLRVLWQASTLPESPHSHWGWCLCKKFFGKHQNPWVCDCHWERCLSRVHLFGKCHYPWVCDDHLGQCL